MSCAVRDGLDSGVFCCSTLNTYGILTAQSFSSQSLHFRIAHISGERTHMSTDVSIQVLGFLRLPNETLLTPHSQPSVQVYTLERLQCGD
jgi:hypothetical protein